MLSCKKALEEKPMLTRLFTQAQTGPVGAEALAVDPVARVLPDSGAHRAEGEVAEGAEEAAEAAIRRNPGGLSTGERNVSSSLRHSAWSLDG